MPTRAEIFNEALTVLEDNPRANIFNEAQEELDRKTSSAVRTFELLNNPESEMEDFVSEEQAELLKAYFEKAENPQAEREKFVEADMVSLSTGMPNSVATMMHPELKADGTIDAIKGEWTGERPGFFKRGFKKFGRSFVNTLATISTKTPFGKTMTELDVFADRIDTAREAGLMPKNGSMKDFLAIPKADIDELFGGESLAEHIARRGIERAQETPGLEITAAPEAVTVKEKAADVAGNIAGFVAKLALTKKALGGVPSFGKSLVTWETVNLVEGGTPGKGAAMFVALRGIDKIPVKGARGFFVKTGTQSGLFAGVTAAAGGTQEEVLTAAAIPWALRAVDLAAKTGVKLSRKILENRAVSNLRNIGKENGVNFEGVPDETLKFIIGKSRQARFWNKQFDKGKISEETLNKRLDLIRKDVEPALRAIFKQQPKAEAKPGEIVPVAKVEPTVEPPAAKPVVPAPERVQPAKGLEAKQEAVGKVEAGLVQEAKKHKTADDFVFAEKTVPIEIVSTPVTREQIIEATGKIGSRHPNQPIVVRFKDGKIEIRDGNNRYYQKLDSGAKTINVVFTPENDAQLTAIWNKAQAQPTPTELEITTPDQSLIDERRGIRAIPAKQRTPSQIERLVEIETELVDRNIERFPRQDITAKVRKTEIRKVTKDITEHDAYKVIAEGAEAVPELQGVFNVGKSEMSDVIARFEGRPEILKKFSLQETGGRRWDTIAGEVSEQSGIAIDTLDEFMDAVELFVESKTKAPGVNQAFLDKAIEGEFPDLELLDTKHELLQEGETAAIINQELTDAAEQLGIAVDEFLLPVTGVTEAERRAEVLKEVTKEKPKRKVKNLEKEAIVTAQNRAFKEKTPIFITEKDGKFSVSKRRPTKGEFVRVTPAEPGQIEGKTERLIAGPTPEEVIESKKLKQQINIVAKTKGFTKKKFNEIKMQHGGTKKLTRMDVEQLKATLKGVKRARPKIVNQKTVVTPKTERQIGTLRENLTKAELMNEDEWDKILAEETGGKLPKYISEKAFITQSQGRKVLAHMHDTAEKLRATESFRKAIEADEEITLEFEKLKPTENVIGAKNPSRLLSMRFFIEKMSERTGEPLYPIWQDMVFTHQRLMSERRKVLNSLEAMPGFIDVATDPKAMQRISDFIASKSKLKNRPKSPDDITPEEEAIAGRIEGIYKQYELHARIGKFFQHIDDLTKVPQYQQHKKAIDLALDIYNTEGLDALFDYLNTQPWGIIGSGYEPMESTIRGVRTHELPLIAVPKTHIKERGIEYTTQERNILQRTQSYMRQMDFLAFLQPKIKSLVRSVNETLDQFDKPQNISGAIGIFLDNLKKTNNEDGLVEEVFRKIYSQSITTLVLSDPLKIIRNFLQNLAFNQDRKDFLNPKNRRLTEQEAEYLETFVHQDRVMLSDWAFTGEEPFDFPIIGQFRFGINKVTKWVQRRTLYPASDRLNRTGSFWAKVNRVQRAFSKDQSLAKKMQEAEFSDMQQSEQQYALGVLARDGVDAMAMYVAKVHTDNTHFMYAREQRSPAEQTRVGKLVLNLALFKRAALEKVILQLQKTVESDASFKARKRAAFVFVNVIAWSIITNLLWKSFTGKKFGAYDFINFLEFEAGGLQLGAVDTITDVYNNMLRASKGDLKALEGANIAITRSANMFIPFYDLGLRAVEATIGAENIDRIPLRKLRETIDNEYKSRGIQEVDRNLVEKLQFVFAKGRVEKETKKRKIGKR